MSREDLQGCYGLIESYSYQIYPLYGIVAAINAVDNHTAGSLRCIFYVSIE